MLQEVARNADHTTFSLTRRTRNDLDQRDIGGIAPACELAPPQFALPALFDAFVCHSQLGPQASPGSTLHWSSYSVGAYGPKVLLSQPRLFAASVFTERLPDFIEVSSRLTMRLRTSVQEIGFATGGKGGERLSDKLAMPISDATMLWSLFLVPLPEIGVVGGTPGSGCRESRSWRSVYRWGHGWRAPQATQVADRWHILSNLGDAVGEFLIRAHIRLPAKEPAPDKPLLSFSATPACQQKSQARLLRKWKLYERVQELHAAGMSLRKIGEELGLARNTVRTYVRQAPQPPLPTPRPLRASRLDPYEDYLAHAVSVQQPSRHARYAGF
jgi:hypothetical protein